ncbi:MAG: M48 family metallopeptidase [Pseudomonadota bacterium]
MNFYQAQDNARRKTGQLVLLFFAAVVTLVILTNILVVFIYMFTAQGSVGMTRGFSETLATLPAENWILISTGVIGIIALASGFKFLSLRGGGRTIAEALGGQLLNPQTATGSQQRLLNVVEEMAIASGISVPPVYLIPEPSINAFAAGFSPDDAVIGINQGTLDLLNREELQGVVAHEFSHILNGDTRINLRLIAILHGILFIGMIGYGIMRTGGFSRRNGLPVAAMGLGLLVVGYGGTFFGNLIKAAVSRQREFLADASAVQFTRNPDGIANALKKIGGATYGSFIENSEAEQASHMFFGAAAKKFAGSMFATHPPLDARISAINPNWDGQYEIPDMPVNSTSRQTATSSVGIAGFAQMTPDSIAESVGRPDTDSLEEARQVIASTPDMLLDAAHDSFDARALIYAMLISTERDIAAAQIQHLAQHADAGVAKQTGSLLEAVANLSAERKLMLLEISIPALKALSKPQYKRFMNNTASLITADKQVDVLEWVLHRVLIKDLYGHFEGPQQYHGRVKNLRKYTADVVTVLSIIASHGHTEVADQIASFESACATLNIDGVFEKQAHFNFERLNESLGRLRKLTPLAKPELIKACAISAEFDGEISDTEYALLQGISVTLDCPLPARLDPQTR